MAGKILLQQALQKPYERRVFITEILQPVFQNKLQIPTSPIDETPNLSQTETSLIKQVLRYGSIALDDDTDIVCYEITLHDAVRLEQNRISIQQYVRKLMVAGDVMLINFIQQKSPTSWRLSLVASDTKVSDTGEIKDTKTNAKRYTYLLGQAETCLTAASQLAILESKSIIERKDLIEAFAVEKVSKPFFDEYTKIHYKRFNDYLIASNFKAAVFNGDEKAMRDFVKKLLGRIVFLYFVQKKGWLGAKEGFASSEAFLKGDSNFIMNLFTLSGGNETFYPLWLSELFFNALNAPRPNDAFVMPDKTVVNIPFLNGGLFEKDKHDEHFLTFPPQFFHNTDNAESDKERGFLDFLNAYNFTVDEDSPDDHTVAVDPEMLGHIFENLLEDNKDKGAFYTPKEIVHYMCQESLIEYLTTKPMPPPSGKIELGKSQADLFGNDYRKGQLPMEADVEEKALPKAQRADIEELIKHQRISEGLLPHLKTISHKLESVRICDPAIGSGAFPMGLLHEIFNAKILLHQAIEGVPPTPKQRVEMKLHIIQNSIYGVDIERGAVDIARLRFWLSLIVDEQTPKALPNLDYKIVVGNSLVSKFEDEVINIDWDKKVSAGKANDFVQHIQRLLKEVADKQKQYFDAEVNQKQALTSKIRALKLELLINQFSFNKDKYMNTTPQLGAMFPTAREIKANTERLLTIANFDKQIKKLQTLQQHPEKPFLHFDWKLDFPEVLNPHLVAENGGFDIVIGNPPYVQLQKMKEQSLILKEQNFETFESTGDLYCLFYEKGFHLLKTNGIHTFITSSQWLKTGYGKSLRQYFLKYNPLKLLELGPNIFENATVDSNILIAQKANYQKILKGIIINKSQEIHHLSDDEMTPMAYISAENWAVMNPLKQSLLTKLQQKGKALKDWKINIYRGVLTGYNEAFLIDETKRQELIEKDFRSDEIIKPILRGRDIDKYVTTWEKTYLLNVHNGIKSKEIDRIKIENYSTVKIHIDSFGENVIKRTDQGDTHYNLRNCAYLNEFFKEKIIWKRIGSQLRFSYSDEAIFCLDSTCIATGEKMKYLTALLNSKLCHYQLFENAPKTGMGDLIISVQALEPLLVYYPTPEQQKPFEKLVDEILTAKKAGKNTEDLEGEIDRLVYELYELTAAEIAVVEGR